ncbi:hypothetical protein AJ79_02170 [Helicocarpus griseus UAMH5409]|uniref:Carboxypeptidase n=1 Tax=Helicocarpus griseus UAMH5409 TaxID=1447875 RepID=A0A2B7Y3G6_9EURO|nr:hypothetical protein AJ79_02170 [Helicocarpus griseus UAMH5409]
MWFPTRLSAAAVVVFALADSTLGQYFPPTPKDLRTVSLEDGVSISYKQTTVCETTPGVKSYSGYVHLPPGKLEDVGIHQNYSINSFFWFFGAREDPANAPLAIWMNGGPGASSMYGLFMANGPCAVNHDSNSTTLNPYSWNNKVNMLYLDQPVQTGLSYDSLVNMTVNLGPGVIRVADFSETGVPTQNDTFWIGTYPSQNPHSTANTTLNAARSFWHFAQVWFQGFPEYKLKNDKISIWAESYGGKFGPAFSRFLLEQNKKIEAGIISKKNYKVLHIDTLGIVNGCIDAVHQLSTCAEFAYGNNTYGIKAIDETTYQIMIDGFHNPGGCLEQIEVCRGLSYEGDPEHRGNNATVNEVCNDAYNYCLYIESLYSEKGRANTYDIAYRPVDSFPRPFFQGYLNRPHVQADIGIPLNYTSVAYGVDIAYNKTGDFLTAGQTSDVGFLLESGVKVALMYGDRDFVCNWVQGETSSLAVDYVDSSRFRAAGYADIQTNSSYVGGKVRQYGNFSFSRVYQAGHMVPAYQPETALEIFHRAMFNRDIATGKVNTAVNKDYSTEGPTSVFHIKNEPPPKPKPTCYVIDFFTCTVDQMEAIHNGSALIRDWILIDENTKHLYPDIEYPPHTPTVKGPKKGSAASTELAGGVFGIGVALLALLLL